MRSMKEVNEVLDRQQAQIFAIANWVTTLAALHPASSVALLSLPGAARSTLLFEQQSDEQIERCVAALQLLSKSFAETRLSMAQEDIQHYSPKKQE